MPLEGVPADLRSAIEAVEALQEEYAEAGAGDSEPDSQFHRIIQRACDGKVYDWSKLDWDLYDHADANSEERRLAEEAKPKLTAAAKRVYELILLHNSDADVVQELREYAWR